MLGPPRHSSCPDALKVYPTQGALAPTLLLKFCPPLTCTLADALKVYVGNIPPDTSVDEIRDTFKGFGRVSRGPLLGLTLWCTGAKCTCPPGQGNAPCSMRTCWWGGDRGAPLKLRTR